MKIDLLIPLGGGRYSVRLLTAASHLFSPGSHLDHDIIIVSHLVDDGRDHPTQHEDANDHAPEKAEVQLAEIIPDASREIQQAADNRNDLNCSHHQGYQHRNQGDVQIVVELPDRFHESPAIRAEHYNAIGSVKQAHASREQQGEN